MQHKCADLATASSRLKIDLIQAQRSKRLIAADKTREAYAARAALAGAQVRLMISFCLLCSCPCGHLLSSVAIVRFLVGTKFHLRMQRLSQLPLWKPLYAQVKIHLSCDVAPGHAVLLSAAHKERTAGQHSYCNLAVARHQKPATSTHTLYAMVHLVSIYCQSVMRCVMH